jgi:hypothetical protein
LQGPSHIYRSSRAIDRLSAGELSYARQQRFKEIEMWSIIKEFMFYAVFFTLICLITLSNRGTHQFYQVNHLRHYFLNTRQINQDYTKVNRSFIELDPLSFLI